MKISSTSLSVNGVERSFAYREDSIGDSGVIQQIFVGNDYGISHWHQGQRLLEYHAQQSQLRPSLIIDAGANIGASAVYFSMSYSNSVVFAIEPDETNWHLLSLNTQGLNCVHFRGAIAEKDGELALIDPGRSDWGFMTAPPNSEAVNVKTTVKSISPESILAHEKLKNSTPLIFKIDIEGGEHALFSDNDDWMNKFPLIIIELHDWMLPFSGSSKNFIKAVAKYDFDVVYRGENIFLFNQNILNS